MKKRYFIFCIIFFLFLTDFLHATNVDTGAAGVICDYLKIVTGRIGRAIAIIIIMGLSFACFTGSINWQKALTVIAGLALFFGAKNFAIVLLPSKVINVSGNIGGKVFSSNGVYTPDEIIAAACPEL